MRMHTVLIAAVLILLIPGAAGQQGQRSVLLPASEMKAVSNRYSRDRSEKYDGAWQPAHADLYGLEASLPQISNLAIAGWGSRIHIEHPERYFRQYLGVRVLGRDRIFVSAFCDRNPTADWRKHLFIVVDGATC